MEIVEESLKRKFASLRTWWRATRIGAGFLWGAAFLFLIALLCFHVDRFHPQSAFSRETWRAIILATGIVTALVFAIRSLLRKLSDSDLAEQVERRYPVLRERLLTTVSLLPALAMSGENLPATGFSRSMSVALAEETFKVANPLDFRHAVSLKPFKTSLSAFAITLVLLMLHLLFAPLAFANWLRRMADPRNDVAPWARTRVWAQPASNAVLRNSGVDVVVTTQGISAENATLFMKASGDAHALAQSIPLANPINPRSSGSKNANALPLPAEVSNEGDIRQFRYHLKSVPENMTLYATSNDGRSNEKFLVVEDRPTLLSLRLTYRYPAYMHRPANSTTVNSGGITAPFGTEVDIAGTANKPLKSVEMTLNNRPSGFWSAYDNRTSGRINVRQDGSYALNLTDTHGFKTSDPPKYEIVAQKDQTPTVQISRPASDIDLQPEGSLPLIAHAKDDYGIASAHLVYETTSEAAMGGHKIGAKGSLLLPGADGKPETNISERWHIAGVHPQVGDTLSYFVSATDNDTLSGPHTGKSVSFRVHVRSLSEMQKRMMELLAAEQQSLAELRKRQIDAQNLLRSTRQKPTPANASKAQEAQRAVSEEAKQTQQRISDTSAQLENNRLATESELKRRKEAEEIVKKVAQSKAPAAAETIQKAQPENQKSPPNSQSLAKADAQETDIRNDIERAQAKLSRVPGAEELAKEIERLAKEQQDRGDASRTIAEDMSAAKKQGKPVSPEDKEALKVEKQHQEELARDTQRAEQELKDAAKTARERGQEKTAQALDRAAEAIKKGQAESAQQAAQQSLNQNNPSAAAPKQDKAAAALAKAAEIAKEATDPTSGETQNQTAERLEKAAADLKNLAKQEKALAQKAGENPDKAKAEELANEQRDLQKQTKQAEQSLAGASKAQKSAQSAQQSQSKASQSLSKSESSSAKSQAQKAAEQLEKAAEEAQRAADRIRRQQQSQELADKIEQLAQVQRGVLNATQRLQKSSEKASLSANEERELGQTAERQKGLEDQTKTLAESIPSAAFKQALELASRQMHPAAQNLNLRRPNTGQMTQAAQSRAYETLETIAQALKEQSQNGGGGKGGEGGAGESAGEQQQEASALAELMLAKGLQQQLRQGTATLDRAREKGQDKKLDPGQQQEASQLAEGEKEAKSITETAGEDLSSVPGVQQMTQEASTHIQQAGKGLGDQQTGETVQSQQDAALKNLEQAIKTTQQTMKQKQEQQQQGGGKPGMPMPVPGAGKGKGKGNNPATGNFTKLVNPEQGALNGGSSNGQNSKGFGPMNNKQQRVMRDGKNDPVPAEYRDLVKRYFSEKAPKRK